MNKIKSDLEKADKQMLVVAEKVIDERIKIEKSGIKDIRKEWKTIIDKKILVGMEIFSERISNLKSSIGALYILNKSLIRKALALENINNIKKEKIEEVLNVTQNLFNITKEMQSIFSQNYSDDIDLSNEYVLISDKQLGALFQILDIVYLFEDYIMLTSFWIMDIIMQYGTPNKDFNTIKEGDVIENKYVIELMAEYEKIGEIKNDIKNIISSLELDILGQLIQHSEKDIEKFNKKSN